MHALIAVALTFGLQAAAEPWTWTLYDDEGSVVLANEIPDTPRLRATLECAPGSGVIKVSLYGAAPGQGFATLTAGGASATSEAGGRGDHLQTTLRTDHPVFAALVASGRMSVAAGEQTRQIDVDREHLGDLRRLGQRCAG